MNKPFEVPAKCYSDDHVVECEFDAAKWLKKASLTYIIDLAKCRWGGDYPADRVAIDMAGKDKEIAFMFKYIEHKNRGGKRDHIGFECHVDEVQARSWLCHNRPKVYAQLW
jgi:hypothetical protein